MRDPKRIPEVLAAVGAYWAEHPDLRLGQIIVNASFDGCPIDPFFIEDDLLSARLRTDASSNGGRAT